MNNTVATTTAPVSTISLKVVGKIDLGPKKGSFDYFEKLFLSGKLESMLKGLRMPVRKEVRKELAKFLTGQCRIFAVADHGAAIKVLSELSRNPRREFGEELGGRVQKAIQILGAENPAEKTFWKYRNLKSAKTVIELLYDCDVNDIQEAVEEAAEAGAPNASQAADDLAMRKWLA